MDIAARQDYTAIAAAIPLEEDLDAYDVPFLGRLPHGLTYRQIAQAVAKAVRRIPTEHEIRLIADATGGYGAVVEMVAEELAADPVRMIAATFTGGELLDWSIPRTVKIGKARLVRRLQVLLQEEPPGSGENRLHLPRGPEALAMKDELQHYEIRPTDAGKEQYGAFKTGKHDDLVTAVGLATLPGPHAWAIPVMHLRTWLPGWEQGLLTSEEESFSRQARRAARRKPGERGARSLDWFTHL